MSQSLTPAQQYAAIEAKEAAPRMIATIDQVRRNSSWIARGALAVTTPHQVLYIGSLGHGHGAVEIGTAWLFALLIPAVTDLGMLTMLRISQTTGMHRQARRRALTLLAILVAESATVNAIAPGHLVFRVLVAFAAVVLAMVEWVHVSVRPDFAEIEAAEAAVTPAAPAVRKLDPQVAAARAEKARITKEANRLAKMTPQQRAALTRQARRDAELADMVGGHVPANAPVSPAPVG